MWLPPQWEKVPFTITIRSLPAKMDLLSAARLQREALRRDAEAERSGSATYYTDGSISALTGAVGDHSAIFRLPDGCSSAQAELIAIRKALSHAVERTGAACESR